MTLLHEPAPRACTDDHRPEGRRPDPGALLRTPAATPGRRRPAHALPRR
ncbi:hypothetical protein LT493_04800 [Streptomyces tricolor]|nr:hypothetical protein [Streptomyces tricolor]